MADNNIKLPSVNNDKLTEEIAIPELSIYEAWAQTARRRPDETALTYYGNKLSHSKLHAEIKRCACAFIASGIKEGDVIALCLPNLPATVIAFYAANLLGCICNMIHPLSPAKLVERHLKKTKSSILFISDIAVNNLSSLLENPELNDPVKEIVVCAMSDDAPIWKRPVINFLLRKSMPEKKLMSGIITWKDFMRRGDHVSSIPARKGDYKSCSAYLHSGGTTADPKTIMLSDYNFNAIACQGWQLLGYSPADTTPYGKSMITVLPLFHGFGLCIGMHTCLINDITVHLLPRFSPKAVADLIKKEKANYLCGVPTLFEALLKSDEMDKLDLSNLEAIFCGGDSLMPELKDNFDNFLEKHGSKTKLREGYGLTETVTVCSVVPGNNAEKKGIGLPLSNVKMKIIDSDSRKTLGSNKIGEICVNGPTTMLGYLNDETATKKAVVKHSDGLFWVETGDLGYRDDEGYYHFKGRLKRTIKVSGVPVFPKEIEELISSLEQVRYVAAIGIAHPYKMSVVKAFVVAGEGADLTLLKDDILRICKESLIVHAVPQQIEFRKTLPLTSVGKVDIKMLEEEEKSLPCNSDGSQ